MDELVLAAFLIVVSAPLIDLFVRPSEARSTRPELRDPAPPPALRFTAEDLWMLVPRTDAWWKDGFGLRDQWIRWHNALELFVMHVRPTDQIQLGRDAWFFYAANRSLDAELGLAPFTEAELDAWQRMFEARRAWCERRGMRLVVAIAPSKGAVYSERLPAGFARVGASRREQLARRLGDGWRKSLVDLEPSQREERKYDRPEIGDWTWFPLGTHWTERGAAAGYRAIAAVLAKSFKSITPIARDEFEFLDDPSGGDSWASRLYLFDRLQQPSWYFRLNRAPRAEYSGEVEGFARSQRWLHGDPSAPKLLVFHDSMLPPMRPWLADHFRESVFFWQYDFETPLLEREKPDVVLLLFSDRYLVLSTPSIGADIAAETVSEDFARSKTTLLALDIAERPSKLVPQGKLALAFEPNALIAEVNDGADSVLLPKFEPPKRGVAVLHAVIESPTDTQLDLSYKTHREPTWARKRTWQVALHAGSNDVYLELLEPDLTGELLMRPGRVNGRYRMRALEVRAVER